MSTARRCGRPPILLLGAALILVVLVAVLAGCTPGDSGDALHTRALTAYRANQFTEAMTLLDEARAAYRAESNTAGARACTDLMQDIEIFVGTYSLTDDDAREALAEAYPNVPESERAAWLELPDTETLIYDGETHYFGDLVANLAYRDIGLFRTKEDNVAGYRAVYEAVLPYVKASTAADPYRPYADPASYTFTQSMTIPRDILPATGNLQLWFPLPIEGGPQTDVRVQHVTPQQWMSLPPSTADDIGLLYMDVPLDQLTTDLVTSITFSFTHAPQYFTIDPNLVGSYDTNSALYKQYTASNANTAITPAIRAKAKEIVGAETNPYLAARLIYDYVVDTIKYSHMPHLCMHPRGTPESIYVHEHGNGDCGAQSMYFSALCRSVGIPARSTGGFQIFMGTPSSHFWAEFYLPNYGWIPVDTSAAQISSYLPELSDADNQAFKDFYFGNQDPLRLVVQRDTDLPLIPRADGTILLPLAVQVPAVLCDTMDEIPGAVAMDLWSIK